MLATKGGYAAQLEYATSYSFEARKKGPKPNGATDRKIFDSTEAKLIVVAVDYCTLSGFPWDRECAAAPWEPSAHPSPPHPLTPSPASPPSPMTRSRRYLLAHPRSSPKRSRIKSPVCSCAAVHTSSASPPAASTSCARTRTTR